MAVTKTDTGAVLSERPELFLSRHAVTASWKSTRVGVGFEMVMTRLCGAGMGRGDPI